jgi:hypothetical protein
MSIPCCNHQVAMIKEKNKDNALMVYSKTYVRSLLRCCLLKRLYISDQQPGHLKRIVCLVLLLSAPSALIAQR